MMHLFENAYSNIIEIAEEIFGNDYKPPNSIGFKFECDDSNLPEPDLMDFIYGLTIHGIRILYGVMDSPASLTEKQFERLNNYVNSYGWHMNLAIEEGEKEKYYKIKFIRYNEQFLTACGK